MKDLVRRLVGSHGSRDPFQIADDLGYIVVRAPLKGVRGFFQYTKQCSIIYIDSEIDDSQAAFVCAHELGHSLLHKGHNKLFMSTHTHAVMSRYERDADRFAVDLLFDDYDLQDLLDCSIDTIACCLGVSEALAEYRISSVQLSFCPEIWG